MAPTIQVSSLTSMKSDSSQKPEQDVSSSSMFSSSATTAEQGGIVGSSNQLNSENTGPVQGWLMRNKRTYAEPLSEFWGVFILVLFGNGAVAQVVLSEGKNGDWQSISWGWGLGLMIGVYVAGASGAHLNPAVTLANCIYRKFPWRKFPKYMLAQTLGAFAASGVVYANYVSAINTYEGGSSTRTVPGHSLTPSAGIFATYPAPFMTRLGMFFSEFLASAVLMFCIYALQDDTHVGAKNLTPLALFFVLFGIGACFGWETGFAINTARDFGPRLMSYFLGYGKEVWTAGGYYFWIPMVAPFCGTVFGGGLYNLFLFAPILEVK